VSVLVSVVDLLPLKPLLHTQLELEAGVGIGQVWPLSAVSNPHPQRLRHQRHAASCASNIPTIKDFRCFVKLRHYAPTNHPILTNYTFITRSLALSLALRTSFNRLIHCEFMPRWPIRAVDGAHLTPPTQRTRRDGSVHIRSVPLPVAPGGDYYAFVPPAAPSSSTDRFSILFSLNSLDHPPYG
jgi:hypothetical protein